MKKKLLALALSLVLLCGVAAGLASAELWKNWELWGTFGLGHDAEGKTAQWLCFRVDDGFLKFISVKGFDSEDDAEEFLENCFTEKEREYLVPVNDEGDMHEFREDLDEGLFNDKLVHPIIYVKSAEVNKYRIINVYGAHKFGAAKDGVDEEYKNQVKFSLDPWIGWARPGDIVTIHAIYPKNILGEVGVWSFPGSINPGPGGAEMIDGAGGDSVHIKMGTADFSVSPTLHKPE